MYWLVNMLTTRSVFSIAGSQKKIKQLQKSIAYNKNLMFKDAL